MKHALIIEGDPRISVALEARLLRSGFRSFEKVSTEDDAVAAAIRHAPDLIVVGGRLADGSSIEAARRIAEHQDVTMLMVADRARHDAPAPPPDGSLAGPFALEAIDQAIAAARSAPTIPAAA